MKHYKNVTDLIKNIYGVDRCGMVIKVLVNRLVVIRFKSDQIDKC